MRYLLIVFLCVAVGIARWLTPTNPSPRSMRSSTLLRGLINFCNKYMSSLWLMWVHGYTHTHPSTLLASIVPRNFRRYHAPIIYLPQNSHHTYLLWHFHSHSEIYCHATFHRSVYHDTFIIVILHIAVHRWRHSYRVIFCSKYWVVRKIKVWWSSLLEHCPSEERMMETMIPP